MNPEVLVATRSLERHGEVASLKMEQWIEIKLASYHEASITRNPFKNPAICFPKGLSFWRYSHLILSPWPGSPRPGPALPSGCRSPRGRWGRSTRACPAPPRYSAQCSWRWSKIIEAREKPSLNSPIAGLSRRPVWVWRLGSSILGTDILSQILTQFQEIIWWNQPQLTHLVSSLKENIYSFVHLVNI